jgi:hypothetical protein
VPLTGKDGERYIAHALSLTSGARRRAGVVNTAAAALFVRKATLALPSAPQAIGNAFKLTPTELRVLLAIVEVGGVPEGRNRVRHRRHDGQDACHPPVRKDGHLAAGRSRQARGWVCNAAD